MLALTRSLGAWRAGDAPGPPLPGPAELPLLLLPLGPAMLFGLVLAELRRTGRVTAGRGADSAAAVAPIAWHPIAEGVGAEPPCPGSGRWSLPSGRAAPDAP